MTGTALTPDELKQRHADAIAKVDTFLTQGVSADEARKYLKTKEGIQFLARLNEAAPDTPIDEIRKRAIGQLMSGQNLPRMEIIDEPLVKIVPEGSKVSPFSPFFTRASELETVLATGGNLSDRLGLPIASEAQVYDVYEIRPKAPTEVFVNQIAPTSELDGQVTKPGGADQYLVPNRKQYTDAVRIGSIGNDLTLHNELVVSKGLGASIAALDDATPPHRVRPAHIQAGRALGVAGLALEVYDGANSVRTAHRLSGEGNRTGAESELVHFGARSIGGWAGAGIGMATGAVLGVETGPGLLVTGAIGGVAGVFAGEKIAEWTDNRRIYNQQLGGQSWSYDPDKPADGWRRKAPIDSTDDNIDNVRRGDLRASPATENALNYQATSASVELVLRSPPPQRDPFSLAAEAGDAPSSRPTNWERDSESGQWERKVYGPFVERNMTPYSTETADDARAERLDRQAAQIVVENAANSPASIAARYEDAYIRNGWKAHGEIPDAVRNARTDTDTLVASDGDRYQRQANGRWISDGMVYDSTASGRLHDELEATREVLQARLPPPREIPPVPPMDADARLRDTVAGAYRNAGVDASTEQVADAAIAVSATWDANGLDPATTALQARPQADGRYELASLRLEADGKTYAIAAVTTPEEIERARTRAEITPHAIERPSEQNRDAREQAQREANRQGLSQDAVQQAVAAPTRSMHGERRENESRGQELTRDGEQQKRAGNGQADPGAPAPTPTSQPARATDPRDPDHPDHRLYAQIAAGVARIDASAGRTFDATSERLAMSTLADAKATGITSADHLALNTAGKPQQDGSRIAGGTMLFVVQGQDPSDPAARRSITDVAQAVERPLEQSQQKLDAVNQQLAQQQPPPTQDNPTPDGPTRGPRV